MEAVRNCEEVGGGNREANGALPELLEKNDFYLFLFILQLLFQHNGMKTPSIHVKHRSTWRKIFSVMIFCDAIFENFEENFSLKNSFVLTGGGSSAHVDELYSK